MMAEGHTVVRWAGWLKPLVGEPLELIELPRRWAEQAEALAGQHVASIETRGKHLLLHLSGGDTIHCHAMMYGSWQVALGPDIMSPGFDRDEAWRRLQAAGAREIGDAILDQRLIAGIGNVYKAEGLFLAGIHPQRTARDVPRHEVERLWDVLIPLMNHGVANAPPIVTVPEDLQEQGEMNWVYRRRYKPCLRCEAKVGMVRQGEHNRTTYFCPVCQPGDSGTPVQPSLPELN
jgi:formamidopyrimidine-DNA glycosylase